MICDRLSFRDFLRLPINHPVPDHSAFSRFRRHTRDHESDWTNKNKEPHFGLKEHTAVDTKNGFILSTTLSPASHHDFKFLPYAVCYSMYAGKVLIAYANKGYAGAPNREFLALNNFKDGIMRKDNINAKLTDFEIHLRTRVFQNTGVSG